MFGMRHLVPARMRRPLFEAFGSDRHSHLALNNLDRKLKKYLDYESGTFIEAGGNDGLSQSNTYWFERFRNWRGLLIEAVPEMAEVCRRNRPKATVVGAALVSDGSIRSVRIKRARLMAYVVGSFASPQDEKTHLEGAMRVQNLTDVGEIDVPARTLADIMEQHKIKKTDLFSLDVEGYEMQVLIGMDLSRHRPKYILVETKNVNEVSGLLGEHYTQIEQMSHHDYLFRTAVPL
jgi:FkbM family methyltransferase